MSKLRNQMLIIQSSCPAHIPSNKYILHMLRNRFAFIVSYMLMKGKIRKPQGMKLSSYPSWAPMFHLLCWIFQPEKKNILKSPKPLTAFTCHALDQHGLLYQACFQQKQHHPTLTQPPAGRKHGEMDGVPRKPLGLSSWHPHTC